MAFHIFRNNILSLVPRNNNLFPLRRNNGSKCLIWRDGDIIDKAFYASGWSGVLGGVCGFSFYTGYELNEKYRNSENRIERKFEEHFNNTVFVTGLGIFTGFFGCLFSPILIPCIISAVIVR